MDPAFLPLLELWKRRHGRWLRAEEYRAIGSECQEEVGGQRCQVSGIRGAIARTADDVYEKLPEKERVRDIFLRMTRLDEGLVRGEERRETRRRVRLTDLVAPAESDFAATKERVWRLAD